MSVAEILSGLKSSLKGTVKFIFQPSEEGPPPGEDGGAPLMIKEGVLENPKVDVVFGLHINSATEAGKIKHRSEGAMAASDWFTIKVHGKGSHGSQPWVTGMQRNIYERMYRTVNRIAGSAGATAGLSIDNKTLITYNDPAPVKKMLPSLQATAGEDNVLWMDAVTGSEDLSFFGAKVPSFFFFPAGMTRRSEGNDRDSRVYEFTKGMNEGERGT